MTEEQDKQPDDYEVGYRRPPKDTQFKKGETGNPNGRPRKRGAVEMDVGAILNAPVTVVQDGKPRNMSPKEVELRRILKKAVTGDLRSIVYLLDQFQKYGALERPKSIHRGGVAVVPSSMPFGMGLDMFNRFGPPPWDRRQVAAGRAEYLATRSEEDRKRDEFIGYEDLKEP